MCKYGEIVLCNVNIPAQDSCTGRSRWVTKAIDKCLANRVNELNAGGRLTRGSCCGHGKVKGEIIMQDGSVEKYDI